MCCLKNYRLNQQKYVLPLNDVSIRRSCPNPGFYILAQALSNPITSCQGWARMCSVMCRKPTLGVPGDRCGCCFRAPTYPPGRRRAGPRAPARGAGGAARTSPWGPPRVPSPRTSLRLTCQREGIIRSAARPSPCPLLPELL